MCRDGGATSRFFRVAEWNCGCLLGDRCDRTGDENRVDRKTFLPQLPKTLREAVGSFPRPCRLQARDVAEAGANQKHDAETHQGGSGLGFSDEAREGWRRAACRSAVGLRGVPETSAREPKSSYEHPN